MDEQRHLAGVQALAEVRAGQHRDLDVDPDLTQAVLDEDCGLLVGGVGLPDEQLQVHLAHTGVR